MNYAVILSGGTGNRINTDIPKQYIRKGDDVNVFSPMMITCAIKPILSCEKIDSVYIVANDERRDLIMSDVKEAGLNVSKIKGFANPGTNRQKSILNGILEILKSSNDDISLFNDNDTILVHDAARPFLSDKMLDDCYETLIGHDGVMPVLPMKDTVYMSEDGKGISGLLDRSKIFAGQAPELFRLKTYYEANMALMPDKIQSINGASEPAIMAGMDIVMIPGDEHNYKVTTDADMEKFRNENM